jgi:hypothetical protein
VADLAGLGHREELEPVERVVLAGEVVSIIAFASPRVSRAESRIAVFLPSKRPASSVQRSSVSAASSCMRSSVARSAPFSSPSIRVTWSVASFAAIARPRTSASLLSRLVSSAIDDRSFGSGARDAEGYPLPAGRIPAAVAWSKRSASSRP